MTPPLSILIVEDDPRDMELLSWQWLRRFPDCRLVLATSLATATQAFAKPRHFDCICIDLKLLPDDPSGLGTIQLCRRKAPGVMIVVVSGCVPDAEYELFKAIGGVYVCKKGAMWADLEPIFNLLSYPCPPPVPQPPALQEE